MTQSERPAIILDTNVILDIFYFKDPVSLGLWKYIGDNQLKITFSASTLNEAELILRRAVFDLGEDQCLEIEGILAERSLKAEPTETSPCKCKDKEDQKLLDLAVNISPALIVTKDKRVLKCGKKLKARNVMIVEPSDFVQTFETILT